MTNHFKILKSMENKVQQAANIKQCLQATEKQRRKSEKSLELLGKKIAGQKKVVHAHICTQILAHMHTYILI